MRRVGAGLALSSVIAIAVAPGSEAAAGATPGHTTVGKVGLVPTSRPPSGTATRSAPLSRGPRQFAGWGPCDGGGTVCWTPGEPVVAVGPSRIVQTVNTAATVYDKVSGVQLAQFDFTVWWGAQTTECVDPRALYIASVDRFAFSCTDITPNHVSHIRFAISATADPTGAWHAYAAPNQTFLDQDKIEVTADKFVVAGNSGADEQVYVYNLADVVAGTSNPPAVSLTARRSNVYQAAVEQTVVSPAYLVSSFPGNKLYLATITGTPSGANVAMTEQAVAIKDYPAPIEPTVPGGSLGRGDLDGRIYSAVFEIETSDSKPVIQYSSARLCGTRDCVTSVRLDLSGSKPVVTQDSLIGAPGWDYSYGAPGLNAAGDVFRSTRGATRPPLPGWPSRGLDST